MYWVLAKQIVSLFLAFNLAFPDRDKTSDGTIGDAAHQKEVSGHNPDDTPGVSAERQDADSVPEVRAGDVTTNLRSTVTMQNVIDSILSTPNERDRLIYIIYNRQIWRKSNGWKRETYTGNDPHTGHAHFSGDPNSDEDFGPWMSILRLAKDEEMALEGQGLTDLIFRVAGVYTLKSRTELGDVSASKGEPNALADALAEILNAVKESRTVINVTDEQLVAALRTILKEGVNNAG